MKETSKCYKTRKKLKHFELYLKGKGIDIGCGDDILRVDDGTVDSWDTINGDAMLMSGIKNEIYDFVYSSHCLEHLQNVEIALYNWCRIIKNYGHLYFVVPEYVLYEKMNFPSIYNKDHKQTFSYYITKTQTKRKNHYYYKDIIKILTKLNMQLIDCNLEDYNFDYNSGNSGDQTRHNASAQILFVLQKIGETKNKDYKIL